MNKTENISKVRLCGRDLPVKKRTVIALTYIRGVGKTRAEIICQALNINVESSYLHQLSSETLRSIEKYIGDHRKDGWLVENDLSRMIQTNINTKIEIKCREGMRHLAKTSISGRTRSNGKTAKRLGGKYL